MDITIRETSYITVAGKEYVVRQDTTGVERGQTVFFYDTTKTVAVGYDKHFCLEHKAMFGVAHTMNDKEVSLKSVLGVINSVAPEDLQTVEGLRYLYERIKSL